MIKGYVNISSRNQTSCMHAKTKLLFQLSIWLPQLRDYLYCAMQCWKIHAVGSDT